MSEIIYKYVLDREQSLSEAFRDFLHTSSKLIRGLDKMVARPDRYSEHDLAEQVHKLTVARREAAALYRQHGYPVSCSMCEASFVPRSKDETECGQDCREKADEADATKESATKETAVRDGSAPTNGVDYTEVDHARFKQKTW